MQRWSGRMRLVIINNNKVTARLRLKKPNMRKLLLSLVIVLFVLAGCSKKSECPEENTVAPAAEEQMVKDYLNSKGITTATKYKSNMYYQVLTPGSGGSPNACSIVSVAYVGKLTDDYVFDQSAGSSFELQGLIKGWIQGIPLIQKGGSIRLFLPPSLAYGNQTITDSKGRVIPGGTMMIFDINLLNFQ